jgi:single-stranded-DNA-specific exonuclease
MKLTKLEEKPFLGSEDIGFTIGPRLNAAGRLADMSLGIRCLVTDDTAEAERCAQELDRLNRERRTIESGMTDEAVVLMDETPPADARTVTLFKADWHPGIVGILASRVKDRWHRPAIAFARSTEAGRVAESLCDLDEAVQRAPNLPDLYENRAVALASLQRHEEAQRDRDYALRLQAAAA